ncbi:MAG: hypothetical protein HZY75_13370 [Nocardioidaceae bacterium]|nr:MAG: hypothetical protein HZY75_13370 [Nocardioidaceae bacterium]
MRTLLACLITTGVVLLIGGLTLGLLPVGLDCGSVFSGPDSLLSDSNSECGYVRANARPIPGALIVLGAAAILSAFVTYLVTPSSRDLPSTSSGPGSDLPAA